MKGTPEYENAKLCYADEYTAYFTTCDLANQWGDDWDDAPYEHNAGPPYGWAEHRDVPPHKIFIVMYRGPFDLPRDGHSNSPWSVQDINAGCVAWLVNKYADCGPVAILAGTTIAQFRELIWKGDGEVYELTKARDE